jgi:hypothetical protein
LHQLFVVAIVLLLEQRGALWHTDMFVVLSTLRYKEFEIFVLKYVSYFLLKISHLSLVHWIVCSHFGTALFYCILIFLLRSLSICWSWELAKLWVFC